MPTSPQRWLVPTAFVCVYFFWGSTFVAIRYGVQFLSPLLLSGIRYMLAGLVLLAIVRLRGHSLRISRRELLRAAIIGMLMLTGNNILLGYAEQSITAGYAALLTASVPLLVAVFESVIPGGIPLNRIGWLGTVIGIGGLLLLLAPVLRHGLVVHGSGAAADHALTVGTLILLVGIATWVVGSLISGRYPSRIDPFVGAAWQMTLAGTVNMLLGTAIGGLATAHWTTGLLVAIAWLTVFGSLVGFTAYTYLLHHAPVAKVATYAYVNPVVAVALSAVFLHESLHGSQWIAMAIILVAVAIVTASKAKTS